MKPFVSSLTPTIMLRCDRCCRKFLRDSRYTLHGDPNTTMPRRSGTLTVSNKIGDDLFAFARVGLRLNTCTAYCTASPQYYSGSVRANIMMRATIKTVMHPLGLAVQSLVLALLICRETPVYVQKRFTLGVLAAPVCAYHVNIEAEETIEVNEENL